MMVVVSPNEKKGTTRGIFKQKKGTTEGTSVCGQ